MSQRRNWTRTELVLLLNIYEKLDFGKFHTRNPVVLAIAKQLDRTPASISMKLGNLGSLDERLAARGIKGLTGASSLDKQVWSEFESDREALLIESEQLLVDLFRDRNPAAVDVSNDGIEIIRSPKSTDSYSITKGRLGQDFFRQAVMNAYGDKCAITGLPVRELLIASHIIPWSESKEKRLDVRNGIALNSLHDRAFDIGLITFDNDYRLVCSREISEFSENKYAKQSFKSMEGKSLEIELSHLRPDQEALDYHRSNIFRG